MSRARAASAAGDLEERLQRAMEENQRLKLALRERDEKLTRVQTQFRRLSADWKQSSREGSLVMARPGTSPVTSSLFQSAVLPPVPQSHLRRATSTASASQRLAPLRQQSPTSQGSLPSPPRSPPEATASAAELASTKAALRLAEAELVQLRGLVLQLQQQPPPGPGGGSLAPPTARPGSPPPRTDLPPHQLLQQLQHERSQRSLERAAHEHALRCAQAQVDAVQEELRRARAAPLPSSASTDTAAMEATYRSAMDALARDRDGLRVRVRLLEEGLKSAAAAPSPDPVTLVQLQREAHERSTQVTLLGSRLQGAQAQVETLKGECGRLVEELKAAHAAHAEAAKRILQLEHEKGTLQSRCGRLDEAEAAVQRKNEEIVRGEQELLKLMNALRTCSQETEQSVRREMSGRVADLEAMRDAADEQRRTTERKLLQCQSELADAHRRVTGLAQDLDVYRVELSKVERERAEMATRAAFGGHTVSDLSDEEVHRAFAIAAIHKRKQLEQPSSRLSAAGEARAATRPADASRGNDATGGPPPASPAQATAADALDLYDALRWDESWEQGQLREALATAALDLELAETRCHQMADQVEQGRVMQQRLSEERDALLEENLELRQRITHVQTVLARQQLDAYRKAVVDSSSGAAQRSASIRVCVRALECVSPAMEKALGLARLGEATAVFFTLDGLQEFDTMLSPTLHAIHAQEPLDIHFLYDGLDRDEATLAEVQRTTFLIQLHRAATAAEADGAGSTLVAMAEVPGLTLLAARETTTMERLSLVGGDGVTVGTLTVELGCSGLMLPVLLGRPLAGLALLSAAEMRATLVALRAVRFLRVQVFRAEGLPLSTAARTPAHATIASSPKPERADVDDSSSGRAEDRRSPHDDAPVLSDRPQPYVFYTSQAPAGEEGGGALRCIADTVVRPANSAFTTDPVFDAAPVDHRVVVDRELVRFLAQGTIVFVVFDERATDVRANLGMVEVALHPLLASPQAHIHASEPLRPQGTLSFGLSWVCGP